MDRIVRPVKPYFPPEDIEKVKEMVGKILESGMLSLHTYTKRFEEAFERLCGVKHAIALNSGTAALQVALRPVGLKPGDEVIVPTNTFSATAASVVFEGGRPVFADMNPETLCIDLENIKDSLTAKTKVVIIVHIGGLVPPDIEEIREFCDSHGLVLIEDAAHAQGSSLNGKAAGSFGRAGCFSFYATKVMTTGEGGMLTTNDDELANRVMILRDQGKQPNSTNTMVELGNNWRVTEVAAAIGLVQMERLSEIMEKRNVIARIYDERFGKIEGVRPIMTPLNGKNNYYKYVLILPPDIDREALKKRMRDKGVICGGEVYWPPLHVQEPYKRLGLRARRLPVAEDVCARMICPPIHSYMSREDAEYVVGILEESLEQYP